MSGASGRRGGRNAGRWFSPAAHTGLALPRLTLTMAAGSFGCRDLVVATVLQRSEARTPLNTLSAQDGPQQRALAPGVRGAEAESRGQPLQVPSRSRGRRSPRPKGHAAGLRGAHVCLFPGPFATCVCILYDHWPAFKSLEFSHENPDFQHLVTSWQTWPSGAAQQ